MSENIKGEEKEKARTSKRLTIKKDAEESKKPTVKKEDEEPKKIKKEEEEPKKLKKEDGEATPDEDLAGEIGKLEDESTSEKAPEMRKSSYFEEDEEELVEDHEKWDPEGVVVLHMISFIVGLSNCWRFPYLCYTYGGIAFLIPYSIFLIFCAYPFAYLEVLIGQISQVGHIACWKLAPMFKGVGYCMTLLAYMDCFNIQTALAWSLFYMFQSAFFHPLPWISCDNGYGKKSNGQVDETMLRWIPVTSESSENQNWHTENCTEFYADAGTDRSLKAHERLPGTEYFRGRVQRMWKSGYADTDNENYTQDNGVELFGLDKDNQNGVLELNIDTIVCLFVAFFMLIACMSKGIKLNGKFLLIAVTVPYIVMTLLFFRASGLSGAWNGVGLLLEPKWHMLLVPETWWRAAEQVIYGCGCGYGILITFGSHNQSDRKVCLDITGCLILNAATSIMLAVIFFMFVGHVQYAVNRDIQSFVVPGPGLTFEVMADVLGVLAKSNFYAFCFYFMVFLLGFTTCLASLTFSRGAVLEVLPVSLKYRARTRMLILSLILVFGFVISSLNLNRGGLDTFYFLGAYVGSFSSHACNTIFLIGIAWVWGLREIVDSTRNMGIRQPGIFFQICWKYVSILAFVAILLGRLMELHPSNPTIVLFNKEAVEISDTMRIFGLIVSTVPFAAVILGAIHALITANGRTCKQKFLVSISPVKDHKDILLTDTGKRIHWSHYCYWYVPVESESGGFCAFDKLFGHKSNKVGASELGKTGSKKSGVADEVNTDLTDVVVADNPEGGGSRPSQPPAPATNEGQPEPATDKK